MSSIHDENTSIECPAFSARQGFWSVSLSDRRERKFHDDLPAVFPSLI